MRTVYQSFSFSTAPIWDRVPVGAISHYHWETKAPYRPKSFFQLCFVKNKGVFARLWSDETQLRTVCTRRDDPVWEDSCLECFLQPIADGGYLNVEMNPRGVFLAQWGKSRADRVFIRTLTETSPVVTPLAVRDGWGVELFVPCALLQQLSGEPFLAAAGSYRFNCFKCGDNTAHPHFAAFAPMGENPPGFHNPAHFAILDIREEEA